MSVPREGAAAEERFATGDVRSALYALLSLPDCQRQTGNALAINLLIEIDRVQLLAGDQQRSRHLPTTAARSGVQPVRWRSTPSTDTQDCGSSVAARSTSPSSVGRPRRACPGSSRDVGSHLRSVARFDGSVCNA